MILIILLSFFGLLILIALIGYVLPRNIEIHRSIKISADVEIVWQQISDFENFKLWNPWAEKDPNMTVKISGNGIGSKYEWNGNKSVRSGSMTISKIAQNENVEFELLFGQTKTPSIAELSIKKIEGYLEVTWSMNSDMGGNPAGRYMGLFIDKYVGKDYQKGLNNLKNICENPSSSNSN